MIMGEQPRLTTIDFEPTLGLDEYQDKLDQWVNQHPEGVILTDIEGGTPYKSALLNVLSTPTLHLVSGVNLPLLLELLLTEPSNTSTKDWIEQVLQSAHLALHQVDISALLTDMNH